MQIDKENTCGVLRIQGSLDIGAAGDFRQALRDLLETSPEPELDLSGVEACDTSGIQLLLSARATAGAARKRLRIGRLSAAVKNAGEALGLPAEVLAADRAEQLAPAVAGCEGTGHGV